MAGSAPAHRSDAEADPPGTGHRSLDEEPRTESRSRINRRVLIASGAMILAVALWAIITPDTADSVITAAVGWVSANFGWYYILTATLMVTFVLVIALSDRKSVV